MTDRRPIKSRPAAKSARDNFLRVATRLARSRGLDNFSLRDVSEQLGLSKSMVYQRFQSRAELLAEVLIAYSTALLDDAQAACDTAPKAVPRLVTVLETWLRHYVLKEGGCLLLRGAIECAGRQNDEVRNAVKFAVNAWRAYLRRQLNEAALAGTIPATADRGLLEFEIFSFALGLQHDCLFLREPVSDRSHALAAILRRHGITQARIALG